MEATYKKIEYVTLTLNDDEVAWLLTILRAYPNDSAYKIELMQLLQPARTAEES